MFAFIASATSLVLVERFLPNQEFLPKSIVEMPRRLAQNALSPVLGALAWTSDNVVKFATNIKYRATLEAEYNKLLGENEQLMYQALLNDSLEAENARLNAMLGEFTAKEQLSPMLARVTAKESGNWFSMFTIDKGETDGVAQGMAVINTDGLIGVVFETTERTANVISIIDSRSSIGALIDTTRDQGIIKGTLGVEQTATCRMYYLPADSVPRPGDPVVTSGVMTTGVEASSVAEHMPKGLRIGVVRESARHMDENKNYIIVEPFVDFMHIEEVLVLKYTADVETMPIADDGQVGYTPVELDSPRPVPTIGKDAVENAAATPTPIPRPNRMPGEADINGEAMNPQTDDINILDTDEEGGLTGDEAEPTETDDLVIEPIIEQPIDDGDDLNKLDPDEDV